MKININEVSFTIKIYSDIKRPDLLAYVSIVFIDEHKRHFTFNGFTIRKSKQEGQIGEPYLTFPSKRTRNGFYKFALAEKTLWAEIQAEALKQYDYASIPT